jgi:hypothetical protein
MQISAWLCEVRSCFTSSNMPASGATFKSKNVAMDFVNFYLASFTPARRDILWSLYRSDSLLGGGLSVCVCVSVSVSVCSCFCVCVCLCLSAWRDIFWSLYRCDSSLVIHIHTYMHTHTHTNTHTHTHTHIHTTHTHTHIIK